MNRTPWIALLPLLLATLFLAGCDQLKEKAGMPDPAKVEAEGKAIGAACRHAGRGLEDCYTLNDHASKAAVYAGWKEMNEYMAQNKMEAVPPRENGEGAASDEEASNEEDKPAKDGESDDADTEAADGKAKKAAH